MPLSLHEVYLRVGFLIVIMQRRCGWEAFRSPVVELILVFQRRCWYGAIRSQGGGGEGEEGWEGAEGGGRWKAFWNDEKHDIYLHVAVCGAHHLTLVRHRGCWLGGGRREDWKREGGGFSLIKTSSTCLSLAPQGNRATCVDRVATIQEVLLPFEADRAATLSANRGPAVGAVRVVFEPALGALCMEYMATSFVNVLTRKKLLADRTKGCFVHWRGV